MRFTKRLICVVLLALSLGGAIVVQRSVDLQRDLFASTTYMGNAAADPQIVLLTHVLGGFKGLLVDAVWLRAVKLQQEEKFWELYQLYDWMGKLEPHLEKIWVFNGWNMSYNLVAELRDAEGRWQWVNRAIQYLRNEGLKYNPQSGPIYVNGKRLAGKATTAMGESKGMENLHLVTYDIPTHKYTDWGPIFFKNGDRPYYVNSIAVGKDGSVYTLSRITEDGKTRTDLISIKGPFKSK